MRGPVVYCAEEADNGKNLRDIILDFSGEIEEAYEEDYSLPVLSLKGYRRKNSDRLYRKKSDDYEEITVKLIPYFAFANRGETNMIIWALKH